jgi:large subunit ribosomal protein L29
MGAGELVVMDTEELESRLEESRRELFNLRFQLATGQLDNTARMRTVRKDVARMLTVLRERDITEAEALAAADALEHEPLFEPARREAAEAAEEERTRASGSDADTDAPEGDDGDENEEEA